MQAPSRNRFSMKLLLGQGARNLSRKAPDLIMTTCLSNIEVELVSMKGDSSESSGDACDSEE